MTKESYIVRGIERSRNGVQMKIGQQAEVVLNLIRDENFSRLWKRANDEVVTWNAMQKEELPQGLSLDETYIIITALRHRSSYEIPFDNYMPTVSESYNWFSVTRTMQDQLRTIASKAQYGSHLEGLLSTYANSHFQAGLIVEEFLSVARRDGYDFTYEDVRVLWQRHRLPRQPEEQLIVNFQTVIRNTDRFKHRRISQGLIEEIYESLLRDVGAFDVPKPRPRIKSTLASTLDDPDSALEMVMAIAEGHGVSQDINMIFRSMLISGIFWEFYPLKTANAMVEMVVRKIQYEKYNLPVLGYVPFSKISEAWEQGRLVTPNVLWNYLESPPDCGEGFDATSHFATELQLLSYELEKLEDRLVALQNEERQHRKMLEKHIDLNRRQIDVLVFSLRNPEVNFTIEAHRRLYDVAYATARQDFLNLVGLGFMNQFKKGKAFIYQPTSYLLTFVNDTAVTMQTVKP